MTWGGDNTGRAAFFADKGRARSEVPAGDVVNQPSHYKQGKVETIDCIESAVAGYAGISAVCAGNVVKYVSRAPFKGRMAEDLKKAAWYLDRLIHATEGKR